MDVATVRVCFDASFLAGVAPSSFHWCFPCLRLRSCLPCLCTFRLCSIDTLLVYGLTSVVPVLTSRRSVSSVCHPTSIFANKLFIKHSRGLSHIATMATHLPFQNEALAHVRSLVQAGQQQQAITSIQNDLSTWLAQRRDTPRGVEHVQQSPLFLARPASNPAIPVTEEISADIYIDPGDMSDEEESRTADARNSTSDKVEGEQGASSG